MGSIMITSVALIMGCLLIVAYSKIAEATKNYTTDSNLARANQGLFTMGIVFIVAGIAFQLCEQKCASSGIESSANSQYMYMAFFLLLGIVLTALSGTVVNQIDSDSAGKTWAVLTLVTGILFMVTCMGMIGFKAWKLKSGRM